MKPFGYQTLSQRLHIDSPLLFGVFILCIMGLGILYSASGEDIKLVSRQAIYMVFGFILMILVAQLPPFEIERWSLSIYLFGLVLLIAVWLFGVGKGAQRWLDIGLFYFQPSEIMKLAVPMVVARYLAHRTLPPHWGSIIIVVICIAIPVIMIARQPDLGTALLVAMTSLLVLLIAGMSWRLIAFLLLIAASCAPILWHFMHDYQKSRILTFLNPEQDPLGAGYHIIQSKIAIGSGGMYGKGWLNGTQSHLEFLPERSTDFIFAVYCEEFGLMGVLLLLCVYSLIIIRGLYIAINAQKNYGKLLAAVCTFTFFIYIFVNMGMVIGQLPVVGVPLPLISHGGSSVVTLMLTFGILMSIHTHRRILAE